MHRGVSTAVPAFAVLGVLAFLVAPSAPVLAGVKLIALPARERVEIRLDHPGATLVEEERTVPLAAGVNDVVFAWANTAIDPRTIQFRSLTAPEDAPDGIKVLSVSYPPGENSLTWQVAAPKAGPARVRISYVIGGLDKNFEYRAETAADESSLVLRQYVQLHNTTPETFGDSGMSIGFGTRLERPIERNETRKILASRFDGVRIAKRYTADLGTFGYLDEAKKQLEIPMHFVLTNNEASGLGRPLEAGKVRIFQDDGKGTVAFVGEDRMGFVAKDDEAALFVGVAKDVVVTRLIERSERTKTVGPLSDYDVVVKYEIENFKDQPIVLDIVERPSMLRDEVLRLAPRDVEWQVGSTGTLKDPVADKTTNEVVRFKVEVPPRGADQKAVKKVETFHVVFKNEW
jgi:hypothetical protein